MPVTTGDYVKLSGRYLTEQCMDDAREFNRAIYKRGFVTKTDRTLAWVAWNDDLVPGSHYIRKVYLTKIKQKENA
jgi:hypothetical protein